MRLLLRQDALELRRPCAPAATSDPLGYSASRPRGNRMFCALDTQCAINAKVVCVEIFIIFKI